MADFDAEQGVWTIKNFGDIDEKKYDDWIPNCESSKSSSASSHPGTIREVENIPEDTHLLPENTDEIIKFPNRTAIDPCDPAYMFAEISDSARKHVCKYFNKPGGSVSRISDVKKCGLFLMFFHNLVFVFVIF